MPPQPKTLVMLLAPLALSPLLLSGGVGGMQGRAARMAGCVVLLAVYWASEALPLPVTALLPLVLFPLLGIVTNKDVAVNYFKDTNILFVGSLMVAAAIEASGLHRRMALRVLLFVGTHQRKVLLGYAGPVVHGMAFLMLGAMAASWFLSMWISNTASTAMLIPVVRTLLASIRQSAAASELDTTGDEGGAVEPAEGQLQLPQADGGGELAASVEEGLGASLTTSPADIEGGVASVSDDAAMVQYSKGLLIGVA